MGKGCLWVLDLSLVQVLLLRVFPSYFFLTTIFALLWSWVEEDFTYPWDPSIQEMLPSFRIERTLDLPRHGAARACPWLSTALVAGSV